MPKITIEYRLPEEQNDFMASIHAREALLALWEIEQKLRGLLKHGNPTEEQSELAREIRDMIPTELLDI
jgi:hypothetical protein